jgi:hypothetical protein
MMQKVNVSLGETKMGKKARRREPSSVLHSRSLHRGQVGRDIVLMLIEREKEIKKQRRSKAKN